MGGFLQYSDDKLLKFLNREAHRKAASRFLLDNKDTKEV